MFASTRSGISSLASLQLPVAGTDISGVVFLFPYFCPICPFLICKGKSQNRCRDWENGRQERDAGLPGPWLSWVHSPKSWAR